MVLSLSVQVMPLSVALLLAILVRMLLTGALHEDGLADFCDGMGGGHDRQRVLDIMKDSHIGVYGVLGLIIYVGLLYFSVRENAMQIPIGRMGKDVSPIVEMLAVMMTADVWAKCCASMLVGQLPYARREDEAKAGVVYAPLDWGWHFLRIVVAMLPVALLWWWIGVKPHVAVFVTPFVVEILVASYLRHKLNGYTGDCCGFTFLLCELSIYITWLIV